MHVGRHTTSQSVEIHSFGVHLSMWLAVGKERARMPWRNTPEKFFSAGRGCPRSCARTNPWFCGRILGGKCAQESPPGSAVKHCRFLGTGGGYLPCEHHSSLNSHAVLEHPGTLLQYPTHTVHTCCMQLSLSITDIASESFPPWDTVDTTHPGMDRRGGGVMAK